MAAVVDDAALVCLEVGRDGKQLRSYFEFGHIFAGVGDLRLESCRDWAEVEEKLDRAARQDDALALLLILLDRDALRDAREDAVPLVEEAMARRDVGDFLYVRLTAQPLPNNADLAGSVAMARSAGTAGLLALLCAVDRLQGRIERLHAAWDRLPYELFISLPDKTSLRKDLRDLGILYTLARNDIRAALAAVVYLPSNHKEATTALIQRWYLEAVPLTTEGDRVEDLFALALSLPTKERADYISQFCEDSRIRAEVLDLLAACESDRAFLTSDSVYDMFSLNPGQILEGRFQIVRKITTDLTGAVYEARDLQLRETVVLKTMGLDRILDMREVEAAHGITHPNVCRIYAIGVAKLCGHEMGFIAMELLAGETLEARIATGSFQLKETLTILKQVADGLDALHSRGVTHCNLNPANVMLVGGTRVVITNFVTAQDLSTIDKRGIFGTPAYAASEQATGRGEKSSDLYALALIAYVMITGGPRYGDIDVSETKLKAALGSMQGRRWFSVISQCLEDTDRRFKTANEFVGSLGALMNAHTVRGWASKQMGFVQAIVLLAVLSVAVWWIYDRDTSDPLRAASKIAVLPLASNGPHIGAAGVLDALSLRLARSPDLTIYGAPFRNPGSAPTAAEVRNADLLLKASVDVRGEKVAITLKLQDVKTKRELWSKQFESPGSQVLQLAQPMYDALTYVLDTPKQNSQKPETRSIEAYELYKKGQVMMQESKSSGDVNNAIALLKAALRADPRFAQAQSALADAYIQLYRQTAENAWLSDAISAARTAETLGEGEPEVYYSVGTIYTELGQYEKAVTSLNKAVQLLPNSDDAYRRLGYVYRKWGHAEECLTAYEHAVAINPDYWNNQYQLGNAYLEFGKNQQSLKPYERVIELEPHRSEGYDGIGNVYLSLGKYDAAITAYRRALSIRPNTPELTSNIGTAFFYEHRYREAAEMYEKAIALQPRSGVNFGNLGDAYRALKDGYRADSAYATAILLTQKELEVNPRSASAMGDLALYHAKRGQTTRAIKEIEEARAWSRDDLTLIYSQAIIYAIAGLDQRAIEQVRLAIQKGISLSQISAEPDLEKLRRSPEFRSLLRIKPNSGSTSHPG